MSTTVHPVLLNDVLLPPEESRDEAAQDAKRLETELTDIRSQLDRQFGGFAPWRKF